MNSSSVDEHQDRQDIFHLIDVEQISTPTQNVCAPKMLPFIFLCDTHPP